MTSPEKFVSASAAWIGVTEHRRRREALNALCDGDDLRRCEVTRANLIADPNNPVVRREALDLFLKLTDLATSKAVADRAFSLLVDRGEGSATRFWRAYEAWSGPVERRPQQVQFMASGVAKHRVGMALIAQGLRQNALAVFRLVVQHLLPAFRVDLGEGRKHQSRQNVRQGQVLGGHHFKRGLGSGHQVSPAAGEPAGEAESAGRETVPPVRPEAGQ